MASRRPPSSTSTPTNNPLTTSGVSDAAATPPAVKAKAPAKPGAPRAKKATASKGGTVAAPIEISEHVRRGMIAQAAYLRAERRGFSGGHEREREDWMIAEAEVDALLKAGHGSSAQ
jgi:Protein of unknown function (DUF2934)